MDKVVHAEETLALATKLKREEVDLQKPHSMYRVFDKMQGWIHFLFLLGNVGLQIFSHLGVSIVVRSTVNLNGGSAGIGDTLDCSSRDPTFLNYWDNGGGDVAVYDQIADCASTFLLQGSASGLECLEDEGFEGSDECAGCYLEVLDCAASDCESACLLTALTGNLQLSCFNCVVSDCKPRFENCTGVAVPSEAAPFRRSLKLKGSAQSQRRLQDDVELFDVYEISFVKSIRDTWNAGAYVVCILLLVLSGIWPYTKNAIMFYAYFVPMTVQHRAKVLKWLTIFAKWSLVDVFVVVIIISGLRIKESGPFFPSGLILLAESRIAIYTFALAAIWDLAQGEWLKFKNLGLMETAHPVEELHVGRLINALKFGDENSGCVSNGRITHLVTSVLQIIFLILGSSLAVVSFAIGGNGFGGLIFSGEERELFQFSVFTLCSNLLSPESLEINDSVIGTVFLIVIFLLCGFLIPLYMYSGFIISLYSGMELKNFSTSLDIVGGFSSLDVLVASFVVTLLEWDDVTNAALAGLTESFQSICADPCVETTSKLEIGIWPLAVAAISGWTLELIFMKAFSRAYHPSQESKLPILGKLFINLDMTEPSQ